MIYLMRYLYFLRKVIIKLVVYFIIYGILEIKKYGKNFLLIF